MEQAELNKLHRVLLIITDEIVRVCEKNNINYSLIGGSMLGAARHKGFIPWDDDLDIGMLRSDYERFIEACKTDLDPKFMLQTNISDPNYVYGFAKILAKDTYLVQYGHEKTKHIKGIYIDVFPFDFIPDEESLRKKQARKNFIFIRLLRRKFGDNDMSGWNLKKRLAFTFADFVNIFISKKFLIRKLNENMTAYSDKPSENVSNMSGFYGYTKETVPYKSFVNLIPVQFEDREYMMSFNYDEILTRYYGDYMQLPPVEKRRTHGFKELDFGPYRDL